MMSSVLWPFLSGRFLLTPYPSLFRLDSTDWFLLVVPSSVEKLCILSDSPRVIQLWVSPLFPVLCTDTERDQMIRSNGFLHTLLCGSPSVPACGPLLLSAAFQVFNSIPPPSPSSYTVAPSVSHHEPLVHIPVCIFLLSPFGVDHISWLPKHLSLFCLFV